VIEFDQLIITQNGLRNVDQLNNMVRFVRAGGRFTEDALLAFSIFTQGRVNPPLIYVSRMEDGRLFLHDGHHRCVAKHLAGKEYLEECEYQVGHHTYEDYLVARPSDGWLTPFDLNTEVRVPDFGAFKDVARMMLGVSHQAAESYIQENRQLYCEPRRITTIRELAVGRN
jgi:hypothetical protein